MFDDGILKGRTYHDNRMCEVCGKKTLDTVRINGVEWPGGIKPGPTILICQEDKIKNYIGIQCGCYAKFHRQIAHIEDRMKK